MFIGKKPPRLGLVLICVVFALCALCSCAQSNPPEIPDPTTNAPTEDSTAPSTEPSEMPTEDTTEPTEEQSTYNRCWVAPEEIYVYPFTEEELEEAYNLALELVMKKEDKCESFELFYVGFDPYITDVDIRQAYYGAYEYRDWSLEEMQGYAIYVMVNYSCVYTDEAYANMGNANKEEIRVVDGIRLSRSSLDSDWETVEYDRPYLEVFYDHMDVQQILNPEEISQFSLPGSRPIGGYKMEDGDYWIYVWDEEAQSSRLVKLDYAAPADLSTAEPRE